MGGFEEIDEGILAGEKIGNEDIDDSADIKPIKVKSVPIFIDTALANATLSGSASLYNQYDFPVILLGDASVGGFTITVPYPRGEISPGSRLKVKILYYISSGSGKFRLVINVKPALTGIANLESAMERSIISTVGSPSIATEIFAEFPPSVFNNNQILGLKISRDPTNALDTFNEFVRVASVYLEIEGRC